MVDDLLCVSECGYKIAQLNAYINFKTNSKKLQFGPSKCKKIHVGKICEDFKCQPLKVDSWSEVEVKNEETAKISIEDCFLGEEEMEEKSDGRYLGDILSNDGRNMKNVKSRVNKGIPFGKYYFEVAMVLLSSLLLNSEGWVNYTEKDAV